MKANKTTPRDPAPNDPQHSGAPAPDGGEGHNGSDGAARTPFDGHDSTQRNGAVTSAANGAGGPASAPANTAADGAGGAQVLMPRKKKEANRKPVIFAVVGVLALLGVARGVSAWRWGQWHVSTDDAYITSDVIQVTPQVPGRIERVLVTDNQRVRRGQVLATLDDATFGVSVENARAALAVALAGENSALQNVRLLSRTTASQLEAARGGLEQARSGIGAAQSDVQRAQAGVTSAHSGITSAQDQARAAAATLQAAIATRDRAQRNIASAQAQVEQARARAATVGENIGGVQANVAATRAAGARAEQAVKAAQSQEASARAQVTTAQAQVLAAASQVRAAQAQVESFSARLEQANTDLERARKLYAGGAVARSVLDAAQAEQKTASANVDQARAAVQAARDVRAQAESNVSSRRSDVASRQADVASAREGVRAAQAQLEAAQANVRVARSTSAEGAPNINAAQAQVAAAREAVREAQGGIEANRARLAASQDAVAQARAALQQAQSQVGGAEQNVGVARGKQAQAQGQVAGADTQGEQLAVATANYKSAQAKTNQARAALHSALIELGRTRLVAAVDGTVSKRSGQVGQQVGVGQAVMALVPSNSVWVVANFKETQMGTVREGQKVDVEVDSLPDAHLKGHIQSVSAGTGSLFALLPPENATGNFTKVVQRVPVKITFDPGQKGLERLRAGMSALPTVETR